MKKIAYLFLPVLLLVSCEVYRPALPDIPILEQKGDAQVEAGFNFPFSADVSAAYAVTDHLAVQAYGEYDLADAGIVGLGTGRMAVGYYTPWSSMMYVGLYAGGSLGVTNQLIHRNEYDDHTHSDFHTLFAQFDWGIRPASWFEFAVRIAVGTMGYTPSRTKTYYETGLVDHSTDTPFSGFMLEPSARISFGARNFKVNIKGGISMIPNCYEFHEPYMIGLGVSYRFGLR